MRVTTTKREPIRMTSAQYEAGCRKRGVEPERRGAVLRQSRTPSLGEESMARQLEREVAAGAIPSFQREHRFDSERRWRFDFAFVDQRLAVEVEGGTHSRGRHVRGSGFARDCEKYAEASIAGWAVIRVPTAWVKSGRAVALVKRWMTARAPVGARS